MAYKEFKLEPGEAKSLYDLWNAGMEPKTNKKAKKPTGKKTAAKKTASAKKQTGKKKK